MDREPQPESVDQKTAAEAAAVRRYIEAIEVPGISWPAIEARAARVRARRSTRRTAALSAGSALAVAAAVVVLVFDGHKPPIKTAHSAAFATLGPTHGAVTSTTRGGNAITYGPATAAKPGGRAATATPSSSTAATVDSSGLSATVAASPIVWHGRRYRLTYEALAPASLGRRLDGTAPPRSSWQVPSRLPASRRERFYPLALYALRPGATATAGAVAVLGRWGSARPSLWLATPAPAAAPAK